MHYHFFIFHFFAKIKLQKKLETLVSYILSSTKLRSCIQCLECFWCLISSSKTTAKKYRFEKNLIVHTLTPQFGTLAHKRFKSICTEGRLLSSKANIEPNYKLSQDEPSWAFAMILDLSGQFFKHFLFHQRIKELKKLRQQLAYSSFACKSSWIMLSSLDLYFTLRGLSQMTSAYFWRFLTPPPSYVSVCQTLNAPPK